MTTARDQDLPWLRLYTAMLDDDKMLLLSEADRWRFCGLLILKRTGVLDSEAPMRELRIARKLRLEVPELLDAMQRMIDVGLIDERWQPVAWRKRQFPEAMTPAERMRRYRERQRDATVTPPSPTVTPSDVLDTETESEGDTEEDTPPADGGSAEGDRRASAPRRRPTRRMPDDWIPSTDFLCWAATECPLVDLTAELRTLRDHEFKVAHSDWDATARNWMRREQKQLAQRARPAAPHHQRETKFNRMLRRQDEI